MTPRFLSRLRPCSPYISTLLLLSILVLASWALVLAATAGVDLRRLGIGLSSRAAWRPALLALALLLGYLAFFRDDASVQLASFRAATARWSPLLAAAIAACTLALGLRYGTCVAGGSDPYGYVSQADLWLRGELTIQQPLARELPWYASDWSLSPLGYRPAPSGGAIVPTYAPGYPMLMALAKLGLGECGPFAVVPVLGALLVWMTWKLGERVYSRNAGLAASALMASSPTFVFMLLTPMSDVPVSALFMTALLVALSRMPARAFWTGIAVGGAVLVRPNLVLLAVVFLAFFVTREAAWRRRFAAAVAFAAGMLPSVAAVAAINAHLYGAPWESGYGDLGALYAWHFAWTNLGRYSRWLVTTQTPLVLCLALPLILLRLARPERRPALLFLGAFSASVWLCYLFYLPFDMWWSLRFLLPAFPPMLVLAVGGWDLALGRRRGPAHLAAVGCVVLGVMGYQIGRVREHAILEMGKGEASYASVGRYAAQALPTNAVLVSNLHSGSLRFYSGRLTLRYDWLPPEWWPRALDVLVAKGYRPFVVLADSEEETFRVHFGLSDAPDAPGTRVAELEEPRVRVYDPLREAHPAGAPAPIALLFPPPCRW